MVVDRFVARVYRDCFIHVCNNSGLVECCVRLVTEWRMVREVGRVPCVLLSSDLWCWYSLCTFLCALASMELDYAGIDSSLKVHIYVHIVQAGNAAKNARRNVAGARMENESLIRSST